MGARRAVARGLTAAFTAVALCLGLVGAPAAWADPANDPVGTTAMASPTPIITGWLPYWTIDTSTASFLGNSDIFTDVSPFWLTTKMDTSRTSGIMPILQISADKHAAAVAQLRAAGKPVIPAITDGTPARYMAAVLADPAKRASHIRELVYIATNSGYDGIDLDYEQFAFADGQGTWATTQPNWVAFVTELTAAFHARGLKVSATVPSSGYWVYDFAAMGRVADTVRIMTYDYSVGSPGPIAPIWWVRQEIAKMSAMIPPEKLMIGVPVYGRDWYARTISGDCESQKVTRAITARNTPTITGKPGAVVVRDAAAAELKVAYRETIGNCVVERVAWLADERTVADRVQAAVDGGARGAALWTVGGEDPAQQWPLLRTIAQNAEPPGPQPVPAGRVVRVPTSTAENPAGRPDQTVFGILTAVSPAANGFLTAYRCDQPLPVLSSVNYQAGRTAPNTVAVRTDARGEFCVFTSATTHVIFDAVSETTEVDTVAPVRVRDTALDTMENQGRQGMVPAKGTIEVSTGKPNSLVMGNLTVSSPQDNGFTTAWPCSEPRPAETSVNNYVAGRDNANFAAVRTDAQGKICVYTDAAARLIWDQSADTTKVSGHAPQRLGDSRLNGGLPVPAGMEWRLPVGSANQTLFGNLTVASPDRTMYTTLYTCGTTRPLASHNYVYAGETMPTFGLVHADANGEICVYTTAATHLVWDQSAETNLVVAHDPERTLDTRLTRAW